MLDRGLFSLKKWKVPLPISSGIITKFLLQVLRKKARRKKVLRKKGMRKKRYIMFCASLVEFI
ncbi:MAG: hypothetical protein NT163_06930, partial [Chlorobiales bacterium]|nr:hypothetical protein [Chlorobiales bacterium]